MDADVLNLGKEINFTEKLDSSMNLQDKDILQINATIIAGALLFLTISFIASTPQETFFRSVSLLYGLVILITFAISSYQTLLGKSRNSMLLMRCGFIAIIIFSTALIVLVFIIPLHTNWIKLF